MRSNCRVGADPSQFDAAPSGTTPTGSEFDRSTTLVRGAAIVTLDPRIGVLDPGDILIAHGVIQEVAASIDPARAGAGTVMDGSSRIVMPGLIAAHEHLSSTILRGIRRRGRGLDSWAIGSLIGPHLGAEGAEASVRLAAADAVSVGVTTVMHWANNWTSPEEADGNLRGLIASGLRAVYAPGAPSTKWGQTLAEMDEVMAAAGGRRVDETMDVHDLTRIRRDWFDRPDRSSALIRLGVAVRGPARSTLRVCVEEFAAARTLGLPIYMHCAGTRQETAMIHQLEVLDDAGLLGPDLRLAHGTFLTLRELDLVGRHGIGVAVTPSGELQSELAAPRVRELHDRGVVVALGHDSASSGSMDMFAVMRLILGLERARLEAGDAMATDTPLEMATIAGARYLGIDGLVGSLSPGKRADLIMLHRDAFGMAPAGDPRDAILHLARPDHIELVMVDGRIVKRDGILLGVDRQSIVDQARQALQRACERAGATDLLQ